MRTHPFAPCEEQDASMTRPTECSQSTIRLLSPAVAACASFVALGALPAGAVSPTSEHRASDDHRVVHLDARRDVIRLDLETDAQAPAPLERPTDVTRTVVDHQADRVVLRVRVRDLSRTGYRLVVAEIVTSDGRRYEVDVDYSTKPIGPRISIIRFAGHDVDCAGATWDIDRAADQVSAYVPTPCLNDPAWIRVGLGVVGATRDLTKSWADDSRVVGRVGEDQPRLGPRQHHAE